jgi:hypothetical protein
MLGTVPVSTCATPDVSSITLESSTGTASTAQGADDFDSAVKSASIAYTASMQKQRRWSGDRV